MLTRVWAALERIIPRGLLAASMIAAAFVTNPQAIGIYTWAALAMTFFTALTDTPIQHVAMLSLRSQRGRAFLQRYAYWSGSTGVLYMAVSVLLIAEFANTDEPFQSIVMSLSPFILVPVVRASAVRLTARLQYDGLWREVMLYRFYGAILGAAIGMPVVFITKSIFGACATFAISESAYAIFVLIANRIRVDPQRAEIAKTPAEEVENQAFNSWTTYRHMLMFSTFGWLSGQSERLWIGAWAGTAILGTYSFGLAIGRSAGDAIGASQPNVLRADLARSGAQTDTEMREMIAKNLRGGLLLTLTNAIAVVLISLYLLPLLLGKQWSTALAMAPILAISAIPAALTQSTAPVFVQTNKARISYIAPAIALLFGPFVALAAMNSMVLAAWTVLLRECALAIMQTILMGPLTPWREIWQTFLAVAFGAAAIAVLMI